MPSEENVHAEEKNEEHDLALRPIEAPKVNEEEEVTELQPGKRKSPLDNNAYSTKKTVAQGMMDLALLTANASQLKATIKHHSASSSPLYVMHIVFLSISIFLQIVVGILLVLMSRYNINRPSHHSKAELLNNITVIGILLITMIVVGILLVLMSRYNINRPSHHSKAELLNNLTVIGIVLITMVNVLASTLGDYS